MKLVSSHRLVRQLFEFFFLLIALATTGSLGLYAAGSSSWTDAFYSSLSAVCLSSCYQINDLTDPRIWISMLLMSAGGILMILMIVRAFNSAQPVEGHEMIHQHAWHWLRDQKRKWLYGLLCIVAIIPVLAAFVLMPFWHPDHIWAAGEKWPASLFICVSSWYNAGAHFGIFQGETPELIVRAFSVVLSFMGSLGILVWLDLFHPLALRFRMRFPESRIHVLSRVSLYGMSLLVLGTSIWIFLSSSDLSAAGKSMRIVDSAEATMGILTGSAQSFSFSLNAPGYFIMLIGSPVVLLFIWYARTRGKLMFLLLAFAA
ncbi:MAG: hypothetical protein RL220_1770, partial [Bacteroidota bacterium]